ncbi:MAG: hypothetical protein ACT4QE_22965 [Anaerolineales bacterium]
MNRQTGFRIVLGLIVIVVLAGAGFALFNAGAAYGVAQSPEWARLAEEGVRPGGPGMAPWMGPNAFGPHMGYGWGGRGFGGGFGIFGIFGFLFQLLLIFLVLRFIFGALFGWGRWGGWGRGGPGGWEQRGREKFDEWHKQSHGGGSEPTQQSPQQ